MRGTKIFAMGSESFLDGGEFGASASLQVSNADPGTSDKHACARAFCGHPLAESGGAVRLRGPAEVPRATAEARSACWLPEAVGPEAAWSRSINLTWSSRSGGSGPGRWLPRSLGPCRSTSGRRDLPG